LNQKVLNIFVVVLLVGIIGTSSLTVVQQLNYQNLDSQYQGLLTDYETLSSDWDQTSVDLNDLQSSYLTLIEDYASLNEMYLIVLSDNTDLQQSLDDLQAQYDQLLEDFVLLSASFEELEQDYADLQADYAQLQSDYNELQDSYDALVLAYAALELQYDTLVLDYNVLLNDYNTLTDDFLALQNDYDALELAYSTLAAWVRQQILPAQYMVFAEAVRRYYFEDFYVQNKWAEGNISGYWTEFTRFCRDVILHDSQIGDTLTGSWFPDVSNALADCLIYGDQTELLAYHIFYWILWPWVPNWAGYALSGDPLNDISSVIQWCVDEIDYEYDSEITRSQYPYSWDYIKFPVETAFRTMGDCEDQAMLAAAYLESCGFETMMVVIHDPEWYNDTGLYHGVPMVFWNVTAWGDLPAGFKVALGFGGAGPEYYNHGWWMFLDTTWNTPFPIGPSWLDWYLAVGGSQWFDYTKFTYAVCDLDGWVSYTPSVGCANSVYTP